MTPQQARAVYRALYDCWGPQHWWPGDTPFEIMVGAILTQNTNWSNVERAIANMKALDALDAERILALPEDRLAEALRPSGYFNVKARRLRAFCAWYVQEGGFEHLSGLDTETLRKALLAVHGIGPETADDILLYAFERPVFVVDAYTRRIFNRLGLLEEGLGYEEIRQRFEQALGPDMACFNEYHALIVQHGKTTCRPRPLCETCCLGADCPSNPLQDSGSES
ncbi:MAG: endonuclease III domain-containing protein [Gammaproteobacteria bacterium]|nr:MAG: endonuclease III domain-containing protein [Gammaproteobacteria bacterium]